MTDKKKTWKEAVLFVLKEAGQSLHYTEVSDRIVQQKLTKSVGAKPANQVSVSLHQLIKDDCVVKVARGIFALPKIVDQEMQSREEEEAAVAQDIKRLQVNAYGLYWNRAVVDWQSSDKGQLLGQAGGNPVNFADQDAIYLLHHGNEVVYVGQSRTVQSTAGLYKRLKAHHTNFRRTDRWDMFSWFGFRPVGEDGTLSFAPETASVVDAINVLEAILIEGLMPRLNMRRGEGTGEWLEANQYFQVEDSKVAARRLAALTDLDQYLR